MEQRDLGLLALRDVEPAVERDRVPDHRDLLVGIALLGQELRRGVCAVDLEAVLADERLHQAEVVQHGAEEQHLFVNLRALHRSGCAAEGVGAHDMVEEEGRRVVACQIQRGEAYCRIGVQHDLLLEAVGLVRSDLVQTRPRAALALVISSATRSRPSP